MAATILALGHYAPQRRVTNAEIETRLGLEPGWIERRTGILERRFAAEGETLSDMAVAAGDMALSRAGFDRRRIGLLVLATSTPDHPLPPSAPLVAHRLGLDGAGAIDVAGACAGFLYALVFAEGFVRTQGTPALVIAANILSRRTDPLDRNSAILFADAAGAVLLAPSERRPAGILGAHFSSDGGAYDLIQIPAGGSARPFDPETPKADTLMRISDGKAVFAKASALMAKASERALEKAGVSIQDIAHWIPHQANQRIISATQRQLGIAERALVSTVAHYGNSSAATIPFSMSISAEERNYRAGDRVLMSAAGAGLTGGAIVFRL